VGGADDGPFGARTFSTLRNWNWRTARLFDLSEHRFHRLLTLRAIVENRMFGINFLSEHQQSVSRVYAGKA